MVGTNQGTVYNGNQGTGEATVLQDGRQYEIDKAKWAAGEANKNKETEKAAKIKADLDAKMKSLSTGDHWLKHEKLLRGEYDKLTEEGAKLMNVGEDPLNGTSEAALKWRSDYNRLRGIGNVSNQMKEGWDTHVKSMGKSGDKATDLYRDDATNYYTRSPIDIYDTGDTAPVFEHKNPLGSTSDWAFKTVSSLERTKGAAINFDEAYKAAETMMNDPAYVESGHVRAIEQRLEKMDGEGLDALDEAAGGRNPISYLLAQDMMNMSARPDYGADKFLEDYLKGFNLNLSLIHI